MTHIHELSIAALKLAIHVGALPIGRSGVNSPVVMRRSTPAFGSALRAWLLVVVDRRGVSTVSGPWSSTVTRRVGRRRGYPSEGLLTTVETGAGLGPAPSLRDVCGVTTGDSLSGCCETDIRCDVWVVVQRTTGCHGCGYGAAVLQVPKVE